MYILRSMYLSFSEERPTVAGQLLEVNLEGASLILRSGLPGRQAGYTRTAPQDVIERFTLEMYIDKLGKVPRLCPLPTEMSVEGLRGVLPPRLDGLAPFRQLMVVLMLRHTVVMVLSGVTSIRSCLFKLAAQTRRPRLDLLQPPRLLDS